MKVVNLFGGPGSGKSTFAARMFTLMKMRGLSVELITEYAKDVTWEQRTPILSDQLYLTAKQNRRVMRLMDHDVDFAVTDSPILLSSVYAQLNGNVMYDSLVPLIREVYNSYDNISILLSRTVEYSTLGRSQTESEAVTIDTAVINELSAAGVQCIVIDPTTITDDGIFELLLPQ